LVFESPYDVTYLFQEFILSSPCACPGACDQNGIIRECSTFSIQECAN